MEVELAIEEGPDGEDEVEVADDANTGIEMEIDFRKLCIIQRLLMELLIVLCRCTQQARHMSF